MGQYKLPSPQTEAESLRWPAAERRNRAEALNCRQRRTRKERTQAGHYCRNISYK